MHALLVSHPTDPTLATLFYETSTQVQAISYTPDIAALELVSTAPHPARPRPFSLRLPRAAIIDMPAHFHGIRLRDWTPETLVCRPAEGEDVVEWRLEWLNLKSKTETKDPFADVISMLSRAS